MRRYSTEDLLRIIEQKKEELKKPRHNVNEVHQFIEAMGLKEGKYRVRNKVIYKAYKLWGGKKTSKSFATEFGKYFQRVLSGHDFQHYCLNITAVALLNKVDNGLIKF